ncbi:hypothetical protein K7I13_12070 [Brucepastera parasyntrophica]|uniref:hypothetical protein n=1 Tax=Brucepastera parasyntrophica TaxID=2880008 RepID=UPI00210C4FE4|nr:hypothetical protein [Brucepastera parasyntrophica]ULQ59223.1 hypothetical protein K7I13_12070 [Brucepastera parasyntrophica]
MKDIISTIYLTDCLDYMKTVPDKYFDYAICDPQYGIKANQVRTGFMNKTFSQNADNKAWDNERMPPEYITELFRVAKRVVLWGYQYYSDLLPATCGMITWDKKNGDSVFSDAEHAFDSGGTASRMFRFQWLGLFQEDMKNPEKRIHPTQKPVALYDWIYKKYLKIKEPGKVKVFDSHLGSGSNRIAAYNIGIGEFIGCEKDADYFARQEDRFKKYTDKNYAYRASVAEDERNKQPNLF